LEKYDYNLIFKPGVQYTNSDALSRIAQITSSQLKDDLVITYEKYIEDIRTKLVSNSNVIEVESNLFETPEDFSLGHCVSRDFKMSQGIALEFRRKFGQIDQLIKRDKKVTEKANIQRNQRHIIYVINKETFQQKANLRDNVLCYKISKIIL